MAEKNTANNNVYKQVIHPVISIASPFFFLVAADQLIQVLAGSIELPNSFFYYAVILGCGLLKVILNRIFNRERIDRWNIIREFIFTFALVYLLFSVVKPGTFRQRFYPDFRNLYPFILVFIQWITTLRLHQLFYSRELFLDAIKQTEGAELLQLIRNTAELANEAYRDIKRFSTIFIVQGIILTGFLATTVLLGKTISWTVIACIGLFILAAFLSTMAINLFKQEYANLGEGFNINRQTQKMRFYVSVFFVIACLILAVFAANSRSLLEIPKIRWTLLPTAQPQYTMPQSTIQPHIIAREYLEAVQSPFPDLGWLFSWIGMVLGSFFAILILVVLFMPFFSPALFKWLKSRRIIGFLITKLSAFFHYLAGLVYDIIRFFKNLFIRRDKSDKIIEIYRERVWDNNKAIQFKKRREANKILKLFMKIIRWGSRQGIQYYYNQTVQEFITDLSDKFPGLKEPLVYTAAIFEESCFSLHLIGSRTLHQYRTAVRQIITGKQ